ncbi:putative transcription factor B3-Domain family [Helianthus debilis subsp. tardiflorus]
MDPSPGTSNHRKQKPAAQNDGERDSNVWPLSGKPYFYVVLRKSHIEKTFRMHFPFSFSEKLPVAKIPAKIVYGGKVWDLPYIGNQGPTNCRLENQAWEKFVAENKLEVGDACVFELMEGRSNSTGIKLRLQILKDEFPTELKDKAEGYKPNNPICID